jgi:hypothetical protein
MITKDHIKSEIDKVQDEYLDVLYQIIKVFEYSPEIETIESVQDQYETKSEWLQFVNETYGCLADDPIARGEQGHYQKREDIE